MELRCSRNLALLLGAIEPESVLQHRALNASGQHLLVRAVDTSTPLFWAWQPGTVFSATSRSS